MPSTPARSLRTVGGLTLAAGSFLIAAGGTAWSVVTKQLRDEDITVTPHAPFLAGRAVQGPVTAFAQAEGIKANATAQAGGRTFAEVADAWLAAAPGSPEKAELGGQRMALATAASLRTSLLTSVLAFGVSALVAGVGVFCLATGAALANTADD